MLPLSVPRLHVVTDDAVLASEGFVGRARRVLEVGGEAGGAALALHVRGPRSSGCRLFELVRAIHGAARGSGAWLLVNDRVDVALAADAHGAHLGERSLPVPVVRGLLGPERVVGASAHDAAALAKVAADGANHAFVGTVFPTASHPGRPGIGAEGLAEVVGAAPDLPVLAIGGIDIGRVATARAAGAHGVAVLSGIWSRRDPGAAAIEYLAALEG